MLPKKKVALAPSAPAAHRLLMRFSRAARSMSRASARSQRCCGLRPQRPAPATGSAAFGRAGAFGAHRHFDCYAIVSSRAVQSRASARSQALDATCVSRKRHQVHGDASFCAERKIPTNIAGISHRSMQGFREQMPRRPEERLRTRPDELQK